MNRKHIAEHAEQMGVDRTYALKCRLTYIRSQIQDKKDHLAELECDLEAVEGLTRTFIEQSIQSTKNAIKKLQNEHSRLITPKHSIKGITDDDIDAAREYPIEQLVEFGSNGRCKAFCHKSNSESMSWNKRDNKAHCFVCNKSFNPIDVLVERDGYSFIEAVKELS